MNDYTPYDDQLRKGLEQVPLPDENRAWEDMLQRLDHDKKRRRIIPPFLAGCAGILLLLLIGGGITWYVLKESEASKKEIRDQHQTALPDEKKKNQYRDALPATRPGATVNVEDEDKVEVKIETGTEVEAEVEEETATVSRRKNQVETLRKKTINSSKEENSETDKKPLAPVTAEPDDISTVNKISENSRSKDTISKTETIESDSAPTINDVQNSENDEALVKDETVVSDTVSLNVDSSSVQPEKKRSYSFAAGVSLLQQIPVDGQKAVPYNAYGRTGSIADYIPAIDLRFYRDEKWFLQTGFRYGAPQYTKEFVYSAYSSSDSSSGSNITTTTALKLKKTFYHQVPLSFNYYILPGWSVGAGGMWSRFHGAVAERTVRVHDGALLDTVISKHTLNIRNTDSFFTKSHISALFETQYSWRRFTLGVRYTRGLQPYLKGDGIEEKNSAWNLFLRFEFWRGRRSDVRY